MKPLNSLVRVFMLVAAFCVDVRVKAQPGRDISNSSGSECWTLPSSNPCVVAVEAGAGRRILNSNKWRISLAEQSLLERRSSDFVQLIRGLFYVETSAPVQFNTPYAKVWCEGECKALLSREPTSLEVKGLEGTWRLKRMGEDQVYVVAPGLQVVAGEVMPDGFAELGFPQSLPWLPTMKEWAALYPGTPSELKQTLVKFRAVWRQAVEAVSELHRQATLREIASYNKVLEEEKAKRLAQEREDQRLRQLFREKNP